MSKFIFFLLLITLAIFGFRGCCDFFKSPHYITNNAVWIHDKLYSPDSSIAVVYYTLDVGARGTREYKSLLREKDYKKELTIYNVPLQIVVIEWLDNSTLRVKYDPNEEHRLGGMHTELDLTKDTIIVNRINLIVTERIPKDSYYNWEKRTFPPPQKILN